MFVRATCFSYLEFLDFDRLRAILYRLLVLCQFGFDDTCVSKFIETSIDSRLENTSLH